MHQKLWTDVATAIGNFFDDLQAHDTGNNLIILI